MKLMLAIVIGLAHVAVAQISGKCATRFFDVCTRGYAQEIGVASAVWRLYGTKRGRDLDQFLAELRTAFRHNQMSKTCGVLSRYRDCLGSESLFLECTSAELIVHERMSRDSAVLYGATNAYLYKLCNGEIKLLPDAPSYSTGSYLGCYGKHNSGFTVREEDAFKFCQEQLQYFRQTFEQRCGCESLNLLTHCTIEVMTTGCAPMQIPRSACLNTFRRTRKNHNMLYCSDTSICDRYNGCTVMCCNFCLFLISIVVSLLVF